MKSFFSIISFFIVFLSFESFAQTATSREPATVYQIRNRRLLKVGTVAMGERMRVLGKSRSRKWVAVAYKGRKAWVRRTQVALSARRRISSASSSMTSVEKPSSNKQKLILSVGPAFQTSNFGIGIGGGASYAILNRIKGVTKTPLELGAYAYFYPSVGAAGIEGTAFSLSVLASTMFLGTKTKGLGVEAGFSWIQTTVSAAGIPTIPSIPGFTLPSTPTSSSASALGFSFGPVGRYPLSDSIYLTGGIRIHLMSGTAAQIHGGVGFGI